MIARLSLHAASCLLLSCAPVRPPDVARSAAGGAAEQPALVKPAEPVQSRAGPEPGSDTGIPPGAILCDLHNPCPAAPPCQTYSCVSPKVMPSEQSFCLAVPATPNAECTLAPPATAHGTCFSGACVAAADWTRACGEASGRELGTGLWLDAYRSIQECRPERGPRQCEEDARARASAAVADVALGLMECLLHQRRPHVGSFTHPAWGHWPVSAPGIAGSPRAQTGAGIDHGP